ncbi:hypothetical protein KDA_62890 [Dictyobacter alpinus]|uniref:RDD domain-containing protein n=1 Tax=Dictyobacter alpinus TaxID=2014873 RepID=A0A402BHG2_9CHLR|nr:RDD family protein [Dictyobacter alpinus]GCE30805.1 hypothetical protein KDA_62890 [Dictyobacter alpinus]
MLTDSVVGTKRESSVSRTRIIWMRIGAGVIDFIILSCLQIWISSIFGIINPTSDEHLIDWDGFSFSLSGLATIQSFWLLLAAFLYFFLQEALVWTTPGKLLFGLHVVNIRGGQVPITAILLRNVLRFIDALPIFYIVGLISGLMSPAFQRLGDRVAHTTVFPIKSTEPSIYTQRRMLKRYALFCVLLLVFVGICLNYRYYYRPQSVVQSWVNINNSYTFHSTATVPPCGKVTQGAGDFVLNRHIKLLDIKTPEWHNDTVVYPIEYVDQIRCSATITLHWNGILNGWAVSAVKIDS